MHGLIDPTTKSTPFSFPNKPENQSVDIKVSWLKASFCMLQLGWRTRLGEQKECSPIPSTFA